MMGLMRTSGQLDRVSDWWQRSAQTRNAFYWMSPWVPRPVVDSSIVLLDCFSGHITAEFEECIRSKGMKIEISQ